MKKTININLAGILFHIDEDAYTKLSEYLENIRASLKNTPGQAEIMNDIEARIAELFQEKLLSPQHVIGMTELNEVIEVMGQPEDYASEAEETEDQEPQTQQQQTRYRKQLFRDPDDMWVSGVSSGLAHYFGIDPLWIRLTWIVLVFAGVGSPILIYIILWALVPAAKTTAQKLKMHGEPINISNIEKKIKEEFDNVASRVKNVDYDSYGNQIKTGTAKFFATLRDFFHELIKLTGKLLGVTLIFIASIVIISLLVSLLGVGTIELNETAKYVGFDFYYNSQFPIWLWGFVIFIIVGVPFFALFILGLRLIVDTLKPLNKKISLSLWSLWILALIGLSVMGFEQTRAIAFDGSHIAESQLQIQSGDTLTIRMSDNIHYHSYPSGKSKTTVQLDENGNEMLLSDNVRFSIRTSNDSVGKIAIEKSAKGRDFISAKKSAEMITYEYTMMQNNLILNPYFTTEIAEKNKKQQINIIIFIPENAILFLDETTKSYLQNSLVRRSDIAEYHLIQRNKVSCLSCKETQITPREKDTLNTSHSSEIDENDWENQVLNQF